jgi:hypothetical protein
VENRDILTKSRFRLIYATLDIALNKYSPFVWFCMIWYTARCVVVSDLYRYRLSSFRQWQHDNAPNGALSYCRPVSSEARQTARYRAMSPYHLADIYNYIKYQILWFKPSDDVTSRQHTTWQHTIWHASLPTRQ